MFLRKPFRYTFVNATLTIVLINLAVFFVSMVSPNVKVWLSANYVFMRDGPFHCFWQPLTYMFVHSNWSHILFNMIALICFGYSIERAIGSKEFVLFYLLTGFLDGIISIIVYSKFHMPVFLMGASGAIYALLFAYAVIFPRNRIFIWGILPIQAPVLVLLYAVIEFVSQFSMDSTAHLTHLTGFVVAWIYFVVRMAVHPMQIWKDTCSN